MDTTSFDLSNHSYPAHISLSDGTTWDWLEMLLLAGDRMVNNFYYTLPNKHEAPYSRAGGFMRKKIAAHWSVPKEFSGVENDNWVTKSLAGFDSSLIQILERVL